MESKKKKKIILTISLVSIFLIFAVIGTFVAIKQFDKNNDKNSNTSSNVSSSIETRLTNATVDIMDKKISPNYNGNYKFKIVGDITFNSKLTTSQIQYICEKNFQTNSIDGIRHQLNSEKLVESEYYDETIVLLNGRYTKNHYKSIVKEKGRYFGNDDLSEISLEKNSNYVPTYEMSLSGIKGTMTSSSMNEDINPERTKLYIYKHVYNNERTHLLFTITYVYEMLEDTTLSIPDSALDFEL